MKQRRLILIHLIAANLILGRLPSNTIYARPEAYGLRERFQPIARAIAKGDLESFSRLMEMDHPHHEWFLKYRIWFQIYNRCEVWVWRSIFRKVFLITGKQGNTPQEGIIDLQNVLVAFQYYHNRLRMPEALAKQDKGPGRRHINMIFMDHTPPESEAYIDPEFAALGIKPSPPVFDIDNIECYALSLISQRFMAGALNHTHKVLTIDCSASPGSALKTGFPKPWDVISNNGKRSDRCEGWKKDEFENGNQLHPAFTMGKLHGNNLDSAW